MKFNNLQEIAYYLLDNSNEPKSYDTVGDIVNELTKISNIDKVYEICDDYRDIELAVDKKFLEKNIDNINNEEYEEDIYRLIEASENLLKALK